MKKLAMALAILMSTAILTACGGSAVPETQPTTTEPATIIATTTEPEPITEAPTTRTALPNDLLDFALIDRLFSMTLAEFFEEEGREVEPGLYQGSYSFNFTKYGDNASFLFGMEVLASGDSLLGAVMFREPSDILLNRQSLAIGELKQWLGEKQISFEKLANEMDDRADYLFFFQVGKYGFCVAPDGDGDNAAVKSIDVICKSHYES